MSDVEKIFVQFDVESEGNNDLFGEDGIFKVCEQVVDYVFIYFVVVQWMISFVIYFRVIDGRFEGIMD